MIRLIFFLIFTILIFFSCAKNDAFLAPPLGLGEMWDCNAKAKFDSIKMRQTLLGEWEWTYVGCAWFPEKANRSENKGLKIKFQANDTLIVFQNDQKMQTSSWKLTNGDAGLFAISSSPYVDLSLGRIMVCSDILVFNYSYIDGCDNYYTKKP